MANLLVSVDPGKSAGGCVLSFGEHTTPKLELALQVSGGVSAFREMVTRLQEFEEAVWISEKFAPRPGAFGQTLDSTLPLVCEGVLIDRDLLPEYTPGGQRWRRPIDQYAFGGSDKKSRKRLQHKALKDLGYYVTGSMVDSPDADDTRSAIAHGLSYLTRTGHKPTYDLISKWTERNTQ